MSSFTVYELERCIQKLISKFRDYPDFFYSESDMQCYLYHLLLENEVLQKTYRTKDEKEPSILHNEYRTYGKYVTENYILKPSEKGRRGHFDLVILDQSSVSQQKLFKSRILFSIEMAFKNLSWAHFANDVTKLTDKRNKVMYGYILWFLSDEWQDSYLVEEKGKQIA